MQGDQGAGGAEAVGAASGDVGVADQFEQSVDPGGGADAHPGGGIGRAGERRPAGERDGEYEGSGKGRSRHLNALRAAGVESPADIPLSHTTADGRVNFQIDSGNVAAGLSESCPAAIMFSFYF
ncbi:hypothetical protein GCM10010430_43270 [Kitasatospora cystarginea]|uniref:Uncharacterized protein n=1 Tax=Kitasatospora cystarginea TaxID=58350 RepID=A0ABP5R911_9ACTN